MRRGVKVEFVSHRRFRSRRRVQAMKGCSNVKSQTVISESAEGTGDAADRTGARCPQVDPQTVSSEVCESTESSGDAADRTGAGCPHAESQTVSSEVSESLGAGDVQGLGSGA